MDWQPYRQQMLRHCLSMARLDERYAIWAAGDYESKSYGVLDGLQARVKELIEKRKEQKNADPQAAVPSER
jgi:flagellar biosynthesis chaperone FliJ